MFRGRGFLVDIRRELVRELAEAGSVEALSLASKPEKKSTQRQLEKIKKEIEAKDVITKRCWLTMGYRDWRSWPVSGPAT